MQIKLVNLSYAANLDAIDAAPLDAFVADKEILAIREHFFDLHGLPHLSCLITYTQVASPVDVRKKATPRVAKETAPPSDLNERQLLLFERLRAWRRKRARVDGIPPYVIATNRELVAIVQTLPQTASALATIEGIGSGKVERYGRHLLALLHDAPPETTLDDDGDTSPRAIATEEAVG